MFAFLSQAADVWSSEADADKVTCISASEICKYGLGHKILSKRGFKDQPAKPSNQRTVDLKEHRGCLIWSTLAPGRFQTSSGRV